MTHVIARPYQHPQDWEGWKRVNETTGLFDPRIDTPEALQTIAEQESTHAALVAEADGNIVAIAALEMVGSWAHIWRLAVLPEYQSRGVGTQMLQETEQYLQQQGCTEWQLLALSDHAEEWYKRHGFRPVRSFTLLTKEQ